MNLFKNKIINDTIFIDGLSRSGKFYLGKLISKIVGLEYFLSNSEAERIAMINSAGILSDDDASALFALSINESIYSMSIGRNINMKIADGSSINNSFEKEVYIERLKSSLTGHSAIKKIKDENRASVFVFHQSLNSIKMIDKAIPDLKIINIRRHPIDLVYSWLQRGWGKRYGNDALSFEPTFQGKNGVVPYYAKDWADEYLSCSQYDRVVKSIIKLTKNESKVIENRPHDICCVYYDNLILHSLDEMSKICVFLNRQPHSSMEETLNLEKRDTELLQKRQLKLDYIKHGLSDQHSFKILKELGDIYNNNISS